MSQFQISRRITFVGCLHSRLLATVNRSTAEGEQSNYKIRGLASHLKPDPSFHSDFLWRDIYHF